jgi:HAD superfamily hydrolase (TIGR01484 family)
MKIILSDFDGTLFFGKDKNYTSAKNAVEAWQKSGNLFGMVTGRSITHLQEDLKLIGIKPDYYILSTGATVYNKDCELIDIIGIEGSAVKTICDTAAKLDYMFVGASAVDGIHLKQKGQPDFDYNKQFISGFARFERKEAADAFEMEISKKLGNEILVMRQGIYFDMPNITCGKAKGISRFSKLLDIPYNDIYCVGDGLNDLDMLREFQSFSLNGACEQAKQEAGRLVDNIEQMISLLMNEQ